MRKPGDERTMADNPNTSLNSSQLIENLNRQISELKSQVKTATLEMEIMRARMNDLSKEAKRVVEIERFHIPDDDRLSEINRIAEQMERAIKRERRSRRAQSDAPGTAESANPQKVSERDILLVLKLRRMGCYIREISAHTGLGYGTVHRIISRYGNDPRMQELVTEGTQMELTDYFLIRPEDE